MLLTLGGFQYATYLDLNMIYYHIWNTEGASNQCTIILPWVKYHYERLPTGVSNLLDIFKRKLKSLLKVFGFICAYMDQILGLTKGYWIYHV